jgi:hypothetical protein
MRIRQRVEKHSVDYRKQGGIGSYAKSERCDDNARETGRLDEYAESVTDILEQRVHGSHLLSQR